MVSYTTIGDQPTIGICGSGIVDVVAHMINKGLIDSLAVFCRLMKQPVSKTELALRIGEYNGKPSF